MTSRPNINMKELRIHEPRNRNSSTREEHKNQIKRKTRGKLKAGDGGIQEARQSRFPNAINLDTRKTRTVTLMTISVVSRLGRTCHSPYPPRLAPAPAPYLADWSQRFASPSHAPFPHNLSPRHGITTRRPRHCPRPILTTCWS